MGSVAGIEVAGVDNDGACIKILYRGEKASSCRYGSVG